MIISSCQSLKMPRHKRGILGAKKDPKNQILFSFGARKGDEWPSDDSDSDYEPFGIETEEAGLNESKRIKLKRTQRNQNSSKSIENNSSSSCLLRTTATGNIWGTRLPPEVLLIIFKHSIANQGSLPFLCRVSRVCSLWRDVAKQASLWQNIDLSFGWIKQKETTLKWLCNNRLSNVRHLNLSMWKCLNNDHMQVVAEQCLHLESLNLSYCIKVGFEGLKSVVDHCSKLSSLELSSMHFKGKFQYMQSKAVSPQSLNHAVQTCGKNLRCLDISRNQLVGFSGVLNQIAKHSSNLEILELSNCTVSTDFMILNIEKLQAGCPKLQILRLANTKVMGRSVSLNEQKESPGFKKLTELSVALNFEAGAGIDDTFLHRLLKNSTELKLLDLRGCTHLSSTGLQKLHATDLQSLFISQSSIAKYDGIEIIMQKWQHSLQELDLSWNVYPGMSLDMAMRKLSDDPRRSKLEILNLSGTSVSGGRIQSLLEGCPNLKTLNLVSCRGLPRGMKREYKGEALDRLRLEIDSIVEIEDADNQ